MEDAPDMTFETCLPLLLCVRVSVVSFCSDVNPCQSSLVILSGRVM
jgi:hypothetical protein